MTNPSAPSHPLPFIVNVPVVLGVVVYGLSKEEAEQTAQAQLDRHFGYSTQAQNAHMSDLPEITIARCLPQSPVEPVKVIVHLNPDGQKPDFYSNAACDIAIVCTDEKDLQDYGEDDVFKLPVRHPIEGKTSVDAVGHIDHAGVPDSTEQNYVEQVFLVIQRHSEVDGTVDSSKAQGDAP